MKPILILQHVDSNAPGLFRDFLVERGVDFQLRRPDQGTPVPEPEQVSAYAGICICGGTQSANDDVPWIRDEMDLIRAAAEIDLPVIGHCLGGQLISKALGGTVQRHHQPEFGWSQLHSIDNAAAAEWLGDLQEPLVAMQWHYDAFTPPAGATPIMSGEHCEHQAFVIGHMLAMQFHVEPDAANIRHWAVDLAHLIPPPGPGVQRSEEILAQLPENYAISSALARALYANWYRRCLKPEENPLLSS